MATKHADLWGFEVADAPVPECLVEIRARSEREWSSFAARPGADVCSAEAKELARRWTISHRTLERWRWAGEGPAYMKIGGRVVYRLEDIIAFEQGQLQQTADTAPGAA